MSKRVYFPVESFVGLGHFNRVGKIVREMVKAGLDVSVASGSFIDAERFFAGANRLIIPSLVAPNAVPKGVSPAFIEKKTRDERTVEHLKNHQGIQPDVLMSEFWPFDRPRLDQEMENLVMASKQSGGSQLRIVSMRDILDVPSDDATPEMKKAIDARRAWAVKMINENFDAVMVHGDPNFIPLSETFPMIGDIKVPVIYSGYVLDEMPVRDETVDHYDRPVLVSCGAGSEADEMVLSCMTVWEKLLQRADAGEEEAIRMTDHPLHVICGPRFPEREFNEITAWGKMIGDKYGSHVTIERYRDDYTQLLANAAFSVSFAGYNTTLETLALGVPALFVPYYRLQPGKLRVNSEQLFRLEKLEAKGYAAFAHPEVVQDSDDFSDMMLKEFIAQTSGAKPRAQLNFNGAQNTIATIGKMIQEKAGMKPLQTVIAPPAVKVLTA